MRLRPLQRLLSTFAILILAVARAPSTLAAPFDTAADAVLGQPGMTSAVPNYPDFLPAQANMAPSNAAAIGLAPDGRLYVADSDNHRVLSWPDAASFADGAPADLVIGQPDFTSGDPNRGGPVGPAGFFLPQGVCVDEAGNLWVADAFNNRVLRFDDPAATDGTADLVIGQPDFISDAPNLGFCPFGENCDQIASADSLLFPGRVLVRGESVYVADSGNSRVLHYTVPLSNKPFADRVFGQLDDFTNLVKNIVPGGMCENGANDPCGPPSAENFYNPIGLALDGAGNLYVADWNNHRVLRFDEPLAGDTVADGVYGQADFAGGLPNSGGVASGLQLPIDLNVDQLGRLLVADSGNHRVLVYPEPLDSTLPALVFGQLGDLSSNEVNHTPSGGGAPPDPDAEALFGPTGVTSDAVHNVYILDSSNSRALRFDRPMRGVAPADLDGDGDADALDLAELIACLEGPGVGVDSTCGYADLNGTARVDLGDVSLFFTCVTGDGVTADRDCPPGA